MIASGSPYRPLNIEVRRDLRIVEHQYRGERYWVIGDMLALNYYRLNEQEFALLSWVQRGQSLDDIKELFEQRFNPHRITYREIEHYLIDFHRKSLLATFNSDQGRQLSRMGRRRHWRKTWQNSKNLLAIRWRGVDPDNLLRSCTPMFGWFFSKWMVVINVLLMLTALVWLLVHYDDFQAKLPEMSQFFSRHNWLSLVLVLTGMKIAHEFGHGIVFTKYGGRCHELGVMLLVFMPTLYVNTSDSWRFPSKWKRAAVAAAGVYLELTLAALATFAWWFSEPSPIHYICLNIMVLGSVSAILFNGNPLLKFDGYYLLSDLIEIPNLQQRSNKFLRDKFLFHGLGVREGGDEQLTSFRTKVWLAGYAIASYTFRFFLVYWIAFVIVRLFRPAGLEEVAKMFSLMTMSLLIVAPLFALARFFWIPGNAQRVNRIRVGASSLLAVGLLALLFCFPVSDLVTCDFVVDPGDLQTVYVAHDSTLKEVYVEGRQIVRKGEPIALFRNIDVELEVAELEGRLLEIDGEGKITRFARFSSQDEVPRAVSLREERRTIEQRLRELRKISQTFLLKAPCDGMVLPVWMHEAPKAESTDLGNWDGWALHDQNLNALFLRGQPVFRVGDLERPVAKLLIDQNDIRRVESGRTVRLMLDSQPRHAFVGKLTSVAEDKSTEVSSKLTYRFGGTLAADTTRRAQADQLQDMDHFEPAHATYEAFVELGQREPGYEAGLRGKARLSVGDSTLAGRIYHFLNRTFRFEL